MKTAERILNLSSIILVFSGFLVSCSKDNSPDTQENPSPIITDAGTPNGEMTAASIGASGGTLNSADGKLTVTFPAGALSSATEISIQPVTNEAPLGLGGSGYRLLPEGTTFSNPVQLTFHYDEQILKESLEEFLWIITQADDGSWNAMLKSLLDTNANTVTVTITHFSDWALGRFIDFTLTPSSSTIQKGNAVQLIVTVFSREWVQDQDELAPLIPLTGDDDELMPLTPIGSFWTYFKIKQWTMNGLVAPVSNSHGSLNASFTHATYTAPDQIPANNPVAVSVEFETKNLAGGSSTTFFLISNIRVIDNDFYLMVKIDGQEFEYFQNDTSFNTRIYCFVDDDHFQIIADMESESDPTKNIFTLAFSNPSVTTRILNGPTGADNNLTFFPLPELIYTLNYEQRSLEADSSCVREDQYGSATATLTEFTGTGSTARGSFSGTLNEDNDALNTQCKMPIAHSIEGEFRLMVNN